jgi:hypothetical protein
MGAVLVPLRARVARTGCSHIRAAWTSSSMCGRPCLVRALRRSQHVGKTAFGDNAGGAQLRHTAGPGRLCAFGQRICPRRRAPSLIRRPARRLRAMSRCPHDSAATHVDLDFAWISVRSRRRAVSCNALSKASSSSWRTMRPAATFEDHGRSMAALGISVNPVRPEPASTALPDKEAQTASKPSDEYQDHAAELTS